MSINGQIRRIAAGYFLGRTRQGKRCCGAVVQTVLKLDGIETLALAAVMAIRPWETSNSQHLNALKQWLTYGSAKRISKSMMLPSLAHSIIIIDDENPIKTRYLRISDRAYQAGHSRMQKAIGGHANTIPCTHECQNNLGWLISKNHSATRPKSKRGTGSNLLKTFLDLQIK